jgi:ABC-type branched-subunit amino acid transport system substrate-binding protein
VINTVSIYSASFLPLLQAANIPAIGGAPLTGPDFTNPDNFPGTGGDPLDYGGAGYVAAKSGCKSAGVIVDTVAAAGGGAAALKTGFVAGGGPAVKTAVMAADSAPDFSAPVSQIVSSGVDCLLLSQTPQAVVKIVGAVRQSSKPAMRIYTIAAAFPQALASSLGKAANGVVVTESFAIPTAAGTPKFWADMTKYAPSAVKSSESLQAWTGVQIIKDVAASAKAYDNTSLLAAIKKASSVTVEGLPGTLNFTTPAGNPAYARIFAKHDFVYELRNGQFTPLFGGKPQDVSVVLSK